MNDEALEFSLTQYLDNTLSSEETAALEERLKSDPTARVMLEEYRRLELLMKAPFPMPPIAWDKLAAHLSTTVADNARDAEQFEFALGQYADGSLPADRLADLEIKIAEIPTAQEALSRFRRLDVLLKSPAYLPEIHWKNLAAHLSRTIADDAEAEVAEPASIKMFPNRWVKGFGRLALAACVLIASALGIRSHMTHPNPTENRVVIGPKTPGALNVAVGPSVASIVVEIGGPDPEPLQGPAVADISIGAGPETAIDGSPAFADGIITHSPRSLIASNAATVQDSSAMPY